MPRGSCGAARDGERRVPRGREDAFPVFPRPGLVLAGPGGGAGAATGAGEMGGLELRRGGPGRAEWGGGAQVTYGEGMAPRGAGRTTGGVGDWAYVLAAFPLFLTRPMPRYSPIAELSPLVPWGPGPSVGGGCRPVPPPETAVVEAAGEAQAESGGL